MSNALASETSPYLRQHAENPVDWLPWGADALARAREQDKPLLVSIGYSSCHWCHVMERESFEDARAAQHPSHEPISRGALEAALARLYESFDAEHGGFGGAPKFPPASAIDFLLLRGERELALQTLNAMARGGIHDQLGGGFSRYSVDRAWAVPHFEKMLYDNALLARAYLHAWQHSGER